MIRKEPERGGGRRPMLATFVGNNRQMLNDIRDSLSHLRKSQLEGDGDIAQGKPDLSQSTPNLADKAATPSGTKKGLENHTKALAEIRETLRPFQTGGGGRERPQGSSTGDGNITRSKIQHIMLTVGVDEDIAVRALKLCNCNVENAENMLFKIIESRNGSYKFQTGLPSYPVNRRPSFESKYGPSSPAPSSETNSVRSDSPSLSSVPLAARQSLVNGHQTPPPLPPRAPIATHPSPQPNAPPQPQAHGRGHTPPPLQPDGGANTLNGPGTQTSSADIPAGHVQQMIKLMSPGQFRSQVMQQQQQQGQGQPVVGVGLSQGRGVGGLSARQAQALAAASGVGGGGGGGGPLHHGLVLNNSSSSTTTTTSTSTTTTNNNNNNNNNSNNSSSSNGGTSSNGNSTPSNSTPRLTISLSQHPHPPPPPYSSGGGGGGVPVAYTAHSTGFPSAALLHKAVEQSHMLGAKLDYTHLALVAPHDSPLNLSTASSSLLSDGSGGGGGVVGMGVVPPGVVIGGGGGGGSGGGGGGGRGPVVADRRLMAPHAPVIMQSVKSKEVHKPMPQTATAPMSPPPPTATNPQSVGSSPSPHPHPHPHSHPQHPHSYISQVQAQVNMSGGAGGLSSSSPVPPAAMVSMAPPTHPHSHPRPHPHPGATTTSTTSTAANNNTTTTTTHTRNLQIHITGQAPHHVVHSHPHTAGPQYATEPLLPPQHPHAHQQQHPHQHTHGPRPTIQIHIPAGAAALAHHTHHSHHHGHHPHQQQQHHHHYPPMPYDHQLYHPHRGGGGPLSDTVSTPRSDSPVSQRTTSQSPLSMMSTTSSPSTNSDIPDKPPPPYPYGLHSGVSARQPPLPPRVPLQNKPPPPPPPGGMLQVPLHQAGAQKTVAVASLPSSTAQPPTSSLPHNGQTSNETASEQGEDTDTETVSSSDTGATGGGGGGGGGDERGREGVRGERGEKHRCMSPMPQRKPEARERDRLRRDTKVRIYSPQAFKFYMEQHVENVLKIHQQRLLRRTQLENEMAKVNLSEEAAHQMRRMLHQKESNYIRLKRAKMDKAMFEKIKTLGVGAFGEVALCRKRDTGMLYAMKTLRKSDVLKRNQVAHVKAERDILAEADNEWVVKLYYSFQDHNFLYFVMDYVPGGDLMGLLIRMEILEEPLARFYVAELVQAIESVHRMGFIHRDIKPDNILIDHNGHIKLTDFGLCTGFRWTHNSKYYQGEGSHARQDSMEVKCQLDEQCKCEILKPLERRRKREQRCLAHSLVGTPNYIAPEVLLRSAGYTSVCDWWSVGVILYEMLVGRPPFYANTPAETQYKVINWKDTLKIPRESNLSQAAKDLIVRLCCGPEERLGVNGAGEIKMHLFFSGCNFDTLRKQRPPYVPNIRHATDTSNFDPVDPDRLRNSDSEENKKVEKLENGKHPEHAFFEFTFRRFFDDGGHPMAATLEDPDSNSPVYV